MPEATKAKSRVEIKPGAPSPWGYFPYKSEALAYSRGTKTPADLKEAFSMGPPRNDSNRDRDQSALDWHDLPNNWPEQLPRFREVMETYFKAMEELSAAVSRLFALALGLQERYFEAYNTQHQCSLRVLHYPHQDQAPEPGQLRAGAHTDWGDFTILMQDAVGGLEVFDTHQQCWLPVPCRPASFVINIGDLMARWTNDRWVSTLHRVVNTVADAADPTSRKSVAFFHIPSMDAVIEPIAGADAAKYPPITAGKHIQEMFEKSSRAEE
eukprot:TRINITY_DN9428_c0_g1_i1.p1 TRINITY_DN9428_c0_g1~~TRINITY_DN9428_c0_g1_i1.p1  ORF type:complete len:268 (+),score=43.97 TRINITY_DN9428_c0_g1_i1:231-1034(+)